MHGTCRRRITRFSRSHGCHMCSHSRRATVQRLQPRPQPRREITQIIGQNRMLARQRPDCKQPFFQMFQIDGIKLQASKRCLYPRLRLAELNHRARYRCQSAVKRPFRPPGHTFQPALRVHQLAHRRLVGQGVARAHHIAANFLCGLHDAALGIQIGLFTGAWVQTVQFSHRVAQIVFFTARRRQSGLSCGQTRARR